MTQNQTTAVKVTPLGDRLLITMPSSDGTRRSIEVSSDGKALLSVDGIATTAIAPPPPRSRRDIPDGVVDIVQAVGAMTMMVVVFGPLARAFARRIDKRTVATPAAVPAEVSQRLAAIEQAVDSVAVEVERISEGQRFTTKLLSDRTKVEMERVL
ncbi:hypothetical protein [Gemmatimonas groenlandica]|uniref:Uncharacterized protein n=1 Tax=Gemmatimonas groenlandica TaxID=2732249 RepID=A0A6M4IN53_9BACT|nr:hypothetical protein [Gemmatimonas groenlandica]QJR36120.1 hypothetical protein HKW67_11695 [Gemmatimonas groenlandica]